MQRVTATRTQPGSVVDLFCGVGGLSHGFVREGFVVKAGVDIDGSCRHAYEYNNAAKFVQRSVSDLSARDIQSLFTPNEPKILTGCAPCQPFSSYNNRRNDEKWRLVFEMERLVRQVRPDAFAMENVPRLTTFGGGDVFNRFMDMLASEGYEATSEIVDCADYGVPQNRKRLVVMAMRGGSVSLPKPIRGKNKHSTVREAIGGLPHIAAGEQHPQDVMHYSSRLSPINMARIRAARPGGSWHDWEPSLLADCHKKQSGRWYGSVYGRMSWDEPAPTITTQCNGYGNGRFGHPEQDRAISLREAALLQSFPTYYEFVKPGTKRAISAAARWIGNAVPILLAQAMAKAITKAL